MITDEGVSLDEILKNGLYKGFGNKGEVTETVGNEADMRVRMKKRLLECVLTVSTRRRGDLASCMGRGLLGWLPAASDAACECHAKASDVFSVTLGVKSARRESAWSIVIHMSRARRPLISIARARRIALSLQGSVMFTGYACKV